ncbi:MAG: orotidine-5'-phosphate decarboxylase [Chitinophagaceae bacterium]|nr:MAG: orotidine-5'-phosphate decarboxylase [Chitinophagaceae bacterium]
MTKAELIKQIRTKHTYLCVGLDTDITKIPKHLLSSPDPVFEFNRRIIDATKDHCVSYKINTAFYEANGLRGWESMERTVNYIPGTHLKIADAKRGDIGNTASQYAKAFFETMNFDAITVAPYMGEDSIKPFLEHKDKWTILLGLTSNSGARDFEMLKYDSEYLFERVMRTAATWADTENLMFVVGATQNEMFERIRNLVPGHFFLVPGVGAQGGSLAEISKRAMNTEVGLLVNSSRAIIYASHGEDFADRAREAAKEYNVEMKGYL